MNSSIKKNRENILLFSIMVIIAFFFTTNASLHPWVRSESGTDSSVFQTIALMMEKGYMPYKDSFDHKGPLLYIINWVGNKISQQYGIWLIEMGFMTCTLFVIYKIVRLASNKISHALIATFISVSLLFDFFSGGEI